MRIEKIKIRLVARKQGRPSWSRVRNITNIAGRDRAGNQGADGQFSGDPSGSMRNGENGMAKVKGNEKHAYNSTRRAELFI